MTDDLVTRLLRAAKLPDWHGGPSLYKEAANEIERLTDELSERELDLYHLMESIDENIEGEAFFNVYQTYINKANEE